jgi:hypothetical protein
MRERQLAALTRRKDSGVRYSWGLKNGNISES